MFTQIIRLYLVTCVILGAPCLLRCEQATLPMPKDAELVDVFRTHREAFERLAAMGVEDANTTTYISTEVLNEEPLTDGREMLSSTRRNEYKRLLASIRPDLAIWTDWYRITFSY